MWPASAASCTVGCSAIVWNQLLDWMAFTSGFVGRCSLGSFPAGCRCVFFCTILLRILIKYLLSLYDSENKALHLFKWQCAKNTSTTSDGTNVPSIHCFCTSWIDMCRWHSHNTVDGSLLSSDSPFKKMASTDSPVQYHSKLFFYVRGAKQLALNVLGTVRWRCKHKLCN